MRWRMSAILTEPLSCITKSLRQADAVQARLELWQPRRALVTGAGTIGLLATLALRLRGLDVTTFARRRPPYLNSSLVEHIGARYVSAAEADLPTLVERDGPFDIVFEGSGAPVLIEPAVAALAPNGVLALFSVTPGSASLEVDMARLNQAVVLYNRVIVGSAAASWGDYAQAVETIGQAESDAGTRGWLGQLITHRIAGLDPSRHPPPPGRRGRRHQGHGGGRGARRPAPSAGGDRLRRLHARSVVE